MKNIWIWTILRLSMSWILLWSFFDKLFGLGISTQAANSWLNGSSPALGFLKSSTGPLAGIFQSMAGVPLVDWMFMLGLLLIGLALLLGVGIKIAGYSGALMMFLMWASHFPPHQNPVIDEHIIYLLIFLIFATNKDQAATWWRKTKLVKSLPFLE